MKNYDTTLCKVCNFDDSYRTNGDVDYCNECYSVEQGFEFLSECEYDQNLFVSEDGKIYDSNFDFIGCEFDI